MPKSKLKRFKRSQLDRIYIHALCRNEFPITYRLSEEVCNPQSEIESLFCIFCFAEDRLENYYWKDTGENFVDYRQRLRAAIPFCIRYADTRAFGLVFAIPTLLIGSIGIWLNLSWVGYVLIALLAWHQLSF